ncbi:MAG: PEP-CTERM system TPR-repeat protein PrsT, partial [Betaproteobacteria bacterium]
NDVLAQEPDFAEAHLGLAYVAFWQSDLPSAKARVDRAVALAPRMFDAWHTKGDIELAMGLHAEAVTSYRTALALVPRSVPVLINMAWIELGNARYERAGEIIQRLRAIAPASPTADYLDALVAFRRGDNAKARDHAMQVLRASPSHVQSQYIAGASTFRLGDYASATGFLATAVALHPQNLHFRALLVFAYARSNRILEGLRALEPGLKAEVKDRNFWAAAGELYLRADAADKAAEAFEKSLGYGPENVELLSFLGISRLAAGQLDSGIDVLEAALRAGEPSVDAQSKLVLAYLRKRDPSRASEALAVIEARHPDDSALFKLRSAVLLAEGKRSEAMKLLQAAFAAKRGDASLGIGLARIEGEEKGPAVAKAHLLTVLERDPVNLTALLEMAAVAQKTGRLTEMVDWLEKARKLNPNAPRPRILLASHYLAQRDLGTAIAYATEAQRLAPDDAEMLEVLGQAYMLEGNLSSALAVYGQLVELRPEAAGYRYALGLAEAGSGNEAAAIMTFRKTLELDREHVGARFALGRLAIKRKLFSESLSLARQLQALPKGRYDGLVLEGDTANAQGSFGTAASLYRKAYADTKTAGVAMKAHAALAAVGRGEQGEDILLDWLAAKPDDAKTRFYLAGARLQRSAFRLAADDYNLILKREPKNADALNNLAHALHHLGDARALSVAERAAVLAPENPTILDTLGYLLAYQGRADRRQALRAVEILDKATQLAPDNPEIRYHYALALVNAGKAEQAQANLDRVLAAGKPFPEEALARQLRAQIDGAFD